MRGDAGYGSECIAKRRSTPVAVYVAQLTALTAVVPALVGVAIVLMRSRFDRLAIFIKTRPQSVGHPRWSGIDDSAPLVAAIAGALSRRSILVVVTGSARAPPASWRPAPMERA